MASIPLAVRVPDPNDPLRTASTLQDMAVQRQAAARAAALAPGQLHLQQQALQQGQQDIQAGQQQNQIRALSMQDDLKLRDLEQHFVQRDDSGKPVGYDWSGFSNAA